MKRITSPARATSRSSSFTRSSNSPRYLVPATRAARSRESSRLPVSSGGTRPAAMAWASPSATAVLPTPGSPRSTGSFLVRRIRICTTRASSPSRPTTGSSRPAAARAVRSRAQRSSTPADRPGAEGSRSFRADRPGAAVSPPRRAARVRAYSRPGSASSSRSRPSAVPSRSRSRPSSRCSAPSTRWSSRSISSAARVTHRRQAGVSPCTGPVPACPRPSRSVRARSSPSGLSPASRSSRADRPSSARARASSRCPLPTQLWPSRAASPRARSRTSRAPRLHRIFSIRLPPYPSSLSGQKENISSHS